MMSVSPLRVRWLTHLVAGSIRRVAHLSGPPQRMSAHRPPLARCCLSLPLRRMPRYLLLRTTQGQMALQMCCLSHPLRCAHRYLLLRIARERMVAALLCSVSMGTWRK